MDDVVDVRCLSVDGPFLNSTKDSEVTAEVLIVRVDHPLLHTFTCKGAIENIDIRYRISYPDRRPVHVNDKRGRPGC
jgi:hypothetical protein